MAEDTFRMGRDMDTGPYRPVCTLRFDEGNILFENEDPEHGPSAADRTVLLNHFAAPLEVRRPFEHADGPMVMGRVTLEPGTVEHFREACYKLPDPFRRMPAPKGVRS
jgi:hypothetical protein